MLDINELNDIPSWDEKLKTDGSPIYIYGMGNGCEKVLEMFEGKGLRCEGIFTSDDFIRDRKFHGFPLISISDLEASRPNFSIACAFGTHLPEVISRIRALAARHTLVYPDTAVAGKGGLNKDALLQRKDDILSVYELLCDERSKKLFTNLLRFKISGNISYLTDSSDSEELYRELIRPEDNEIYTDIGAYNGDTVSEFVEAVGGKYKHIFAVEPARRNYSKCVKNCTALDNITLINAAASDRDCEGVFSDGAGRQQTIASKGTPVRLIKVDTLLKNTGCTYIKYDVEGEDIPALMGSSYVINKFQPKIRTGIYHRPYDILDIPLLMHRLAPKHKLYIRRKDCLPAWDTELFAIP